MGSGVTQPSDCPKCLKRDIDCDLCKVPAGGDVRRRCMSPFKAAEWISSHPGWVHDTEPEMAAVRPEEEKL